MSRLEGAKSRVKAANLALGYIMATPGAGSIGTVWTQPCKYGDKTLSWTPPCQAKDVPWLTNNIPEDFGSSTLG